MCTLSSRIYFRFYIFAVGINAVLSMSLLSKNSFLTRNSGSDSDLADIIASKGYLPNDKDLTAPIVEAKTENDVTYLLSKLSDKELINLLNEQPKKTEYDLNDIVKIALNSNTNVNTKDTVSEKSKQIDYDTSNANPQKPFFKLDHSEVDPYRMNTASDPNYLVRQKLKNLLYSRPQENIPDNNKASDDDDDKREMLFDILVAQLKTLCCKGSKKYKESFSKNIPLSDSELAEFQDKKKLYGPQLKRSQLKFSQIATEHMFLVLNDEIKSNDNDEIISVDPESLGKNSSVLLLGPINAPMTDSQLKVVMNRISNEISKPEYIPLLQQISDGKLSHSSLTFLKNLVSGPETRRYIKPHRCNHQSKLARVYGGPKWLVCTGYININTPSLYD